jgi:hypothetical protein
MMGRPKTGQVASQSKLSVPPTYRVLMGSQGVGVVSRQGFKALWDGGGTRDDDRTPSNEEGRGSRTGRGALALALAFGKRTDRTDGQKDRRHVRRSSNLKGRVSSAEGSRSVREAGGRVRLWAHRGSHDFKDDDQCS